MPYSPVHRSLGLSVLVGQFDVKQLGITHAEHDEAIAAAVSVYIGLSGKNSGSRKAIYEDVFGYFCLLF